jgi:DNA replication licensing factor MCM7
MAQAIARLHFRPTVEIGDVDEALRLIKAAKASLNDHAGPSHRDTSKTTQIWEIMKQMNESADRDSLDVSDIRRRVTGRGFTEDEMWRTIQEYEEYGVIFTSGENRQVTFVEIGEDMDID